MSLFHPFLGQWPKLWPIFPGHQINKARVISNANFPAFGPVFTYQLKCKQTADSGDVRYVSFATRSIADENLAFHDQLFVYILCQAYLTQVNNQAKLDTLYWSELLSLKVNTTFSIILGKVR